MLAHAVLHRLGAILPGFSAYRQSADNVFTSEEQAASLCGVFAACSHYVRERGSELPQAQASELGAFVTACMSEPGTQLDDAAATCFLENLADEPGAALLLPHLSGHALQYLREQSHA